MADSAQKSPALLGGAARLLRLGPGASGNDEDLRLQLSEVDWQLSPKPHGREQVEGLSR